MAERTAAFDTNEDFSAYPDKKLGGGGGRFFTGSPADGFDCSVCHTSVEGYSYPLEVKSLPTAGYVPSTQYREITVTWPQATAAELEAKSRGLRPSTALMAEFVSEDGGNAGKLEFQEMLIRKDGYCAPLVGSMDPPRFAAKILATTKAKPVTVITAEDGDADPEKRVCQTGGDDERRCLLWVDPCGATSLKFHWTAPPQLHGPVWFSVGFVTTHDATSKPNDRDFSTLLSIPINAAPDGKTYEQNLESGCNVSGAPHARSGPGAGVWWAMMSALWFVHRTRRRHQARSASCALWIGLLTASSLGAGCADSPITTTRAFGSVGKFEPVSCVNCEMIGPSKCRVGTVDDWKMCTKMGAGGAAASRPATTAGNAASVAASTVSPATGAGAAAGNPGLVNGKLQISFTTAQPLGVISENFNDCLKRDAACKEPNYTAVWITDAAGNYVKFLEHNGGPYQTSLRGYIALGQDCVCEADVVSTPTVNYHYQHNVMWNGRDARGNQVPYGAYQVQIDMAIANEQLWHATIPVEIKPPPVTGTWPLIVPPAVPHAGVTLNYIPNP